MNEKIVLELADNSALLLAIAVFYDTLALKQHIRKPILQNIFTGILLGTIGILVMMNALQFSPGIIFDTRSIIVSLSGLIFGPVPAVLTIVMTGFYRFLRGGNGMWTGISVIAASGIIG